MWLIILMVISGGDTPDSPTEVVRRFLEAYNGQDMTFAAGLLADDYIFQDEKKTFSLARDQIVVFFGWDAVMKGTVEWNEMTSRGSDVSVVLTETNLFQRLLDVAPFRYRVTYTVREGRISNQILEELPGTGPSWQEALKPVLRWVTEKDPDALDGILRDGSPVFTEKSARRWLPILRAWSERPEP